MDFNLSTDHEILRDSVRKFAEKEIKPVARELDKKEEFSYETMEKMAELGLFGIFVSDKYGGQAMDYLSYIIAVEEIARIDGSHAATVAAENSLGIGPLYYFGNEEQKRKYLPRLCKGETLWGFGLTEANAGSDAANSKTTAVLDGNDWVINGSKIFITNASTKISAGSTVLCRTGTRDDGRPELSCILVEAGTRGYTTKVMHDKMMWRASNTSELYFEDCRVPKENLLGPRGQGFYQMMQTLDGGRLSIGSMGLGGAGDASTWLLNTAMKGNNSVSRLPVFRQMLSSLPIWLLRSNAPAFCFTRPAGCATITWLFQKKPQWRNYTVLRQCICAPTMLFSFMADTA